VATGDDLIFAAEEPGAPKPLVASEPGWKVAVVDDDESVRAITRLALGGLKVDGRPLDLLEAASAEEGIALFASHPDIALGLIDMVMEAPTAGLKLISAVRDEQGNHKTRLVVRTGQPGNLPEDRVIRDYDINDYREKTELSAQKLRTVAHSAIRSFRDIATLEHAFHDIVDLLAQVVDEKVAEQFPHAVATSALAAHLAHLAGFPATRVELLRHASTLHDIGLMGLPKRIREALLKFEVLEGAERDSLREHPLVGARLLQRLNTAEGRLAATLAREHHERWDGRGYPGGLSGEAISVESRVLAVANVMDAFLSPQPGRASHGPQELRAYLADEHGRELDPDLVDLALLHLDELLATRSEALSTTA
jgi:HD-GYP domain-containing protein (c-di-GMP phosphodiesterase class II)